MKKYILLPVVFVLMLSCNGCKEKRQYQDSNPNPNQIQEDLIEAQRQVVAAEHADIKSLIEEKGWEMTKSGTGVYMEIYEHGTGDSAKFNSVVSLEYASSLVDGTPVYSSENDGLKVFCVGRSEAESGLHEVMLSLRQGDKAHVILPSHSAFGFTGDMNKVPPNSILVYDLTVLKVE